MNIVENVFGTINETLSEFFRVLKTGLDSTISLFYTLPTDAEPEGAFTFLGVILMIGLGIALVWTLIRWISGLVRNVAR